MAKRDRNGNHRLPEELIHEILLRVPADCLVRQCKLVCRTWKTLIDDPTFVGMQAVRDNIDDHSSGFVLSRYLRRYQLHEQYVSANFHIGEYNDHHEDKLWTTKTPCLFEESKHAFKHHLNDRIVFDPPTLSTNFEPLGIVGSSNGLVCVCRNFFNTAIDMTVVNPLTGDYVKIPTCFISNSSFYKMGKFTFGDSKYSKVLYGFGYVPCTKDYKIVTIFYSEERNFSTDVQVFTLGRGTWRCSSKQGTTDDISVHLQNEVLRGMLVDGVLHWMNSSESLIISFDLANEEFGVLPSPAAPMPQVSGWNRYCKLGVLEGCLSVKCVNKQDPEMDAIWILKKNTATWIKKFDVVLPSEIARLANYTPVAVSASGKLLLSVSTTNSLVCYNPQTECYEFVKGCLGLDVIPYSKSLVSLKGAAAADFAEPMNKLGNIERVYRKTRN